MHHLSGPGKTLLWPLSPSYKHFWLFFSFFSSSVPHLQLTVRGSLRSALYTSDCCFLPYTLSKQTSDCRHPEPSPSSGNPTPAFCL